MTRDKRVEEIRRIWETRGQISAGGVANLLAAYDAVKAENERLSNKLRQTIHDYEGDY